MVDVADIEGVTAADIQPEANLADLDLSGATLAGADLSGANLSFARLYKADCSFATLNGVTLTGCDGRGMNIWGQM